MSARRPVPKRLGPLPIHPATREEIAQDETLIDHGVTAVFNAFPGNTWREAALRQVVRVAQGAKR